MTSTRKSLFALFLALTLVLTPFTDLFVGTVNAAPGDKSSDEIEEEINELENRENEIQAQINALNSKKYQNMTDIRNVVQKKLDLEQQVVLIYQQTTVINGQIAAYNMLIADKQEQLDEVEAKLEEMRLQFKARIRAMEEDGALSYWQILFQARSFTDLLDRLNMILEIAQADQRRLDLIREATEEVAAMKATLEEEKAALHVISQELTASQQQLEDKKAEAQVLMDQLLAMGKEYDDLLEQSHANQEAIMDELDKKNQELAEAIEWEEYQEWLKGQDPNASSPAGGNVDANGIYWAMPVRYYGSIGPFNPNRLHPILGYVRPHNGVDLSADRGTPIYAARGGFVTVASSGLENGNFVYINHGDGYTTIYLHMDYYIVTAGQYVSMGQVIGYVGSTGLSTSPHLHFSIKKDGVYLNPADHLNFY